MVSARRCRTGGAAGRGRSLPARSGARCLVHRDPAGRPGDSRCRAPRRRPRSHRTVANQPISSSKFPSPSASWSGEPGRLGAERNDHSFRHIEHVIKFRAFPAGRVIRCSRCAVARLGDGVGVRVCGGILQHRGRHQDLPQPADVVPVHHRGAALGDGAQCPNPRPARSSSRAYSAGPRAARDRWPDPHRGRPRSRSARCAHRDHGSGRRAHLDVLRQPVAPPGEATLPAHRPLLVDHQLVVEVVHSSIPRSVNVHTSSRRSAGSVICQGTDTAG